MKTAIVIGHDKNSPGAYSKFLETSEYIYNSEVAACLACVADIYKRPLAKGYKTQMQLLANEVNGKDYDLIIELHFNAFNEKANGVETVGFAGNKTSKEFGQKLSKRIEEHYGINNRGHKVAVVGGRGYWFLKLMDANALIIEPFFGDHPEALCFKDPKEYAAILKEWLEEIS